MFSNAWSLATNRRGRRLGTRNNRSTSCDLPWAVSPGAGSAAMREWSHRRVLGARAAALPAKTPVVQGAPRSHLGPEQGS
jgi:hypothetical protein